MVGKPVTVLIYIIGGLLIALYPIVMQWAVQHAAQPIRTLPTRAERPANAGGLIFRFSWPLGVICGLLIGSTLLWWRTNFSSISITEASIYGFVALLSSSLLARQHSPLLTRVRNPAWLWLFVIVALLICFVLSFSTGIMVQPTVTMTAWHHWSAFIGPSELMLSGARIFYDFPAQYGFGATTLIAASCGDNCWLGMHYLVATTTLLFALTVLYVVVSTKPQSLAAYGVLLAVVILVCFFWNAYPPLVSSPMETPSVSGLRFLPATSLVAGLIWIGRSSRFAAYWSCFGHAIYAVGALWSPESLFFVTYVWWPYYIWRRCAETEHKPFLKTFAHSIMVLLVVLVAVLLSFLATYRLLYNVFPSANAYFAYMLYPPGEMPIDPKGPVWFSVTALVLGILSIGQLFLRRKNRPDLHYAILVVFLGYATLSYCMGRGHSNNFLNLAPFTAMILAHIVTSQLKTYFRAVAAGMLVSLLGWAGVFGWGAWAATIENRRLFEFQPSQVVGAFSYERSDSLAAVAEYFELATAVEDFANIRDALSVVRAKSKEPIAVIDGNYLLLPNMKPQAWNAYHGPGNVYFMPREWRLQFLRNTKKRLDRSGWLIIKRTFAPEWLEDFQSAYNTTQELRFGAYRALHFSPRK